MAFTNDEIAQIIEEFFKTVGARQYIGARYVPIFGRKDEDSIEWDGGEGTYEPLTIVLYQGNSYTSRQFVPVGIAITDNEFWANTGNYNAQVEQYRQDVAAYKEKTDTLEEIIPASSFSSLNTVKTYIDNLKEIIPASSFSSLNTVKAYIDSTVSSESTNLYEKIKTDYIVFPEDYGAVGDGVTDDTDSFADFLNECASNGYTGVLRGSYVISDNITISNASYVRLVSLGVGSLLIDDISGNVFSFTNVDNIYLNGLKIHRSGSIGSGDFYKATFYFNGCDFIKIDNVIVDSHYSASVFYITGNNEPVVHIADSIINNCCCTGIGLFNSNGSLYVDNCVFKNFKSNDASYYYTYPVCITYFDYNLIKQIAGGLYVSNSLFENCDWEGPDTHGSKFFVVTNCVMHNCGRFFHAYMDGRVYSDVYECNMEVRNNLMYNDDDYSPSVLTSSAINYPFAMYGQLGRYVTNCVFDNNIVKNGFLGESGFMCIKSGRITNNIFMQETPVTTNYALTLVNCHNMYVHDNSFVGYARTQGVLTCNSSKGDFGGNTTDSGQNAIVAVVGNAWLLSSKDYNLPRNFQYNDWETGIIHSMSELLYSDLGCPIGYRTDNSLGAAPTSATTRTRPTLPSVTANGTNVLTCNAEQYGLPLVPGMRIKLDSSEYRIVDISYEYGHKTQPNDASIDLYPVCHLTVHTNISSGTLTLQIADVKDSIGWRS